MEENGDMTLIDTISDTRITIYITGDIVKYNDFYVKAISADYPGFGDIE